MKRRQKMEYIGYWFDPDDPEDEYFPNPSDVVDPEWLKEERDLLVNYLKSGVEFVAWRGLSWCRFECGIDDRKMGYKDLTDGVWVWPEGLYHYIESHNVVLPDEFVNHCRQNQWSIPSEVDLEYEDPLAEDFEFWISWGSSVTGQKK